jgi:hypothetical protein
MDAYLNFPEQLCFNWQGLTTSFLLRSKHYLSGLHGEVFNENWFCKHFRKAQCG